MNEIIEVTPTQVTVSGPSMDTVRQIDEFRMEFTQFLKEKMIAGTDFGVIPNTGGKPTLLKPGAEKLLNYFGYSLRLEVAEKFEDHKEGYFYYKYKATVVDHTGKDLADGYGSANTKEKKWSYKPGWEMANTVDKMAQKRAMVSAALSATRASEFYTQDVEDMDLSNSNSRVSASAKAQERYPDNSAALPAEEEVKVVVTGLAERTSEKSKRTCALFTAENGETYYVWGEDDKKLLAEGITVTGKVVRNVSGGRTYANLGGIAVVSENGEETPF